MAWKYRENVESVLARNKDLPFPEEFYKAEAVGGVGNDAAFISEQLARMNYHQREKAAALYSKHYTLAKRAKANHWLRRLADSAEMATQGQTKKEW